MSPRFAPETWTAWVQAPNLPALDPAAAEEWTICEVFREYLQGFLTTMPPAPLQGEALEGFFQDLKAYNEAILTFNAHTNLTRLTSPVDMGLKNFLDAILLWPALAAAMEKKSQVPRQGAPSPSLADLGSGAGIPGLVLGLLSKYLMPTQPTLALIESQKKRCNFLTETAGQLGLGSSQVLWARSEDLGQDPKWRESFDVVTARAVAPLEQLLEYASGLVAVGGTFLAMKGADGAKEWKTAKKAASTCSLSLAALWEYQLPVLGDERTLLIFEKKAPLSPRYPRPTAQIKKRPL